MASQAVQDLAARATAALKGKPEWGHKLCVDFGPDGVIYVYENNAIDPVDSVKDAECTLHVNGIGTLNDLMSKKETPTQEWWRGNLSWTGDRSIAEQFVALVQGAAASA
jgi:hypothetical protein